MNENVVMGSGVGACTIFTIAQTNQVMQTASLVITCIVGVVTLAYTIYKWYKRASADGKITKDEMKEGIDEVVDKGKDIVDKINDTRK